jgi:hypothetical protein
MTVHEEWTDQLSDYLDGELPAGAHGAVAEHLRSCASCAAVLNDLTRVVTRAESVEARPPQADLWAGIANRIETDGPAAEPGLVIPFVGRGARHFTFTLRQLAAAAAVLMAVSGGIAWELRAAWTGRPEGLHYVSGRPEGPNYLSGRPEGPNYVSGRPEGSNYLSGRPEGPNYLSGRPEGPHYDGTPSAGGGTASADVVQAFRPASRDEASAAAYGVRVENVNLADAQYDAAVADLEQALKAGRGRLDASTIAIVEHNLQIIDQAINQAREALVTDPANTYLRSHLVDARRRKLNLLRRATALTTEAN